MLASLQAARTLATGRILRRGVLLAALALAQRVLTPATAWVLFAFAPFARSVQVKLAVGFALGAVFTVRTLLLRVLASRTEAELMERVIGSVLDGDVLRASVLAEEDAQADLGLGVYFGAQQLSDVLPALGGDLVAALLLAVVVAWVEPTRLVLGATALTLVAAGGLVWSRGRIRRAVRVAWEARERVIDKLVDALEARLEIVASGERATFAADARTRARAWADAGVRASGSSVMSGRIPLLVIAAVVGLALLLDARWRGAFAVTLADVALFASTTPAFAGVAQNILALVQSEPSVRAVARVISDARPRPGGTPPHTSHALPALPASIVFDDVSFGYAGARTDALTKVTFASEDARVLALSGANGSGKSTCLRLVLGLARPRSGVVRVGGVDLSEVDADLWRSHVAFLPQRPYLPMRASVRTSVRLLAPSATDERILAALERVHLVEALRRAGAHPLGVSVDTLSVGQRQRVALARMLCRDAPLFVLDEPDANLDREGIALVAELVRELSVGHRVILAVHTPELLKVADRVIELQRGSVVPEV